MHRASLSLLKKIFSSVTNFYETLNVTHVSCKTTINHPIDAVWRVISDFSMVGQYLSGVVTCTVEGQGVGALRTLTSADSGTIIERLETLDEAAHRLSYILLTDTPFRNCLTTMLLRDLGVSQAELEWSATFEADGLPEDEAREMLEGALSANCLMLKQFMER